MATRSHRRLAFLAATVLISLVIAPGAAAAAPPDPALLEAVTELSDPDAWVKLTYQVHRGEEVAAALGVISAQGAPVRGLVAQVRAYGDLQFTRHYSNCWYTTDGTTEMAWCEFDAVLPGHGGLTLGAPMVTVKRDAVPERITSIPFRWQSKSWADARGGLRKVVDYFKAPGAAVTRGTDGKVGLQNKQLPMADIRANGNHVPLELVDGPPPSPSPSPTPSASPSRSTVPSASPSVTAVPPGEGAGDGGGLPVTGSGTAPLAGAGVALLTGGIVVMVRTRRRRLY